MKKILVTVAAIIISIAVAKAQVKIGDNPTTINANSILEMETANKGMLLPRIALTGTTVFAPLTAHIAGMSVYNTATVADVTPGYYYNDGTKWVRIADATIAANKWDLLGNAGTNPTTNFIGTTDNNPLLMRVNNQTRIKIDTNNSTIIYSKLRVRDSIANTAASINSESYHYNAANGTHYIRHNGFYSTKRVNAGVTDNGYQIGTWTQTFRGLSDAFQNNLTDNDGGTLGSQVGALVQIWTS
jgi:hypothetical protein